MDKNDAGLLNKDTPIYPAIPSYGDGQLETSFSGPGQPTAGKY